MRIAIYTAIFGRKEIFKDPTYIDNNVDYILFTDRDDIKTSIYDIRKCPGYFKGSNLSAKIYKILPHIYLSKYDYSLWHDGHLTIKGDIINYIFQSLANTCNKDLFLFKHPNRDCIYDEANACIQMLKDNIDVINAQIDKYRIQKYPPHNGLIRGGVIFRKHASLRIQHLMDAWWSEIINNSKRDQLSFNYVSWKTSIDYASAPESIFRSFFVQNTHHNTRVK